MWGPNEPKILTHLIKKLAANLKNLRRRETSHKKWNKEISRTYALESLAGNGE